MGQVLYTGSDSRPRAEPACAQLRLHEVISDGETRTETVLANTMDAALADALRLVPENAEIVEQQVLATPGQVTVRVEAYDEQAARSMVRDQMDDTQRPGAVELVAKGKPGFLGIGRTPHQYQATIIQQAAVRVVHKSKAVVSFKVVPFSCATCAT